MTLPVETLAPEGEVGAVLYADHGDPFGFLGMHGVPGGVVVRTFQPWVHAVEVIDAATGDVVVSLDRLREEGFFAGGIGGVSGPFPYRLRIHRDDGSVAVIEDPYRFPPVLSSADITRLSEGNHLKSYELLGAHACTLDGVGGVAFAVWAPNAYRVSVVGTFNSWDGRCHGMRYRHEVGLWEIFLPGAVPGALYKYEIKAPGGHQVTDKCDPYALQVEASPGSASIVTAPAGYAWGDSAWMDKRRALQPREAPVSIYQVHLGSWRRKPEEGSRWLTYDEFADALAEYAAYMGFTHIGLLPVAEFDFDESLGYHTFAPFAPTARWGTPDGFRRFVDRCHQAGVGVILDWVPNHFSDDPHGLRDFDGSHLFEHPDPQQRRVPGGSGLVYDLGRREVANYLISNAFCWLDHYHIDGLRVPDVAAMLYLDYGRSRGSWTPNRHGGPENLDAVEFLKRLNEAVYGAFPGIMTIAEDSSGWPKLSQPTFAEGLGFGFKWDRSWVRTTLRYLARNPVHRKYYHHELTAGVDDGFAENNLRALAHDETGPGHAALLRRMPGDWWQKFANLRQYYALMYTLPGKKLMFMGNEFAQDREWNPDISLDWHLADEGLHGGIKRLVRDLNQAYRDLPSLHQQDCDPAGFAWIDCSDADQGVLSYLRFARDGRGSVAVVCNFTPVVRRDYRIGVPEQGFYAERLNTDAEQYGGGNIGNEGGVWSSPEPMHGRSCSLNLRLPPFSVLVFEHRGSAA